MSEFYTYFKENMEALGLSAPPESLFGTQQLALSTISTMLAYIDRFGRTVTVREMAVAGTRLEKLTTLGSLGAAFYAGAAIGSLAVATGRTLGGGATLGDVLFTTKRWGHTPSWLARLYLSMPGIYDQNLPTRQDYCCRGKVR